MRSSVRMRPSTLSNMNIFKTTGPIDFKFYLKHHWGGERLHQVLGQIISDQNSGFNGNK